MNVLLKKALGPVLNDAIAIMETAQFMIPDWIESQLDFGRAKLLDLLHYIESH